MNNNRKKEMYELFVNSECIENMIITDSLLKILCKAIKQRRQRLILSCCVFDCKSISDCELKLISQKCDLYFSGFFIQNQMSPIFLMPDKLNREDIFIKDKSLFDYISENKNFDLSDVDISKMQGISLERKDLRNVDLPKDKRFFQFIENKSVRKCKLPPVDLSKYDITGVDFSDCIFHDNTILPTDFFDRPYGLYKGCSLPPLDFSNYSLNNVFFQFVKFNKNTKFPLEKEFFKKLKLIYGCTFIDIDFSFYDLSEARFEFCKFSSNCTLPYSEELYNKIILNSFPDKYIKFMDLLPLNGISYDEIMLKYGRKLTDVQKNIIYLRFRS